MIMCGHQCRIPLPKPQVVPGHGVLPPPGTPGSYCPAPAIHYHISYNCCPNRGGAYGMTAPPPMTSTNPDSPMSCGTHYDVVPVERGPPVPAISPPEAAPRRRSMAEAQEEPEEGTRSCDSCSSLHAPDGCPCKSCAKQHGTVRMSGLPKSLQQPKRHATPLVSSGRASTSSSKKPDLEQLAS